MSYDPSRYRARPGRTKVIRLDSQVRPSWAAFCGDPVAGVHDCWTELHYTHPSAVAAAHQHATGCHPNGQVECWPQP